MMTLDEAERLQAGIDSGVIWLMEGSAGRGAMDAIRSGYCMLGKVGYRDYWGNYIPSRTEVNEGTLCSVGYFEARQDELDIRRAFEDDDE